MSHRVVKHAAVIGRKERFGDATLVAYIVPHRRPAPPVSALRKFLEEKLPEYMIPSAFVILEALPMMSTGKVNRRALPEPTYERPNLVTPLVKPRTTMTFSRSWPPPPS